MLAVGTHDSDQLVGVAQVQLVLRVDGRQTYQIRVPAFARSTVRALETFWMLVLKVSPEIIELSVGKWHKAVCLLGYSAL